MMIKSVKTALIFAVMSLSATSLQAQDLLARQAPVDKKMKQVDSVALNQLIYQEMLDNPASDLYDEFDNISTHYRANTPLPDEATIDLRGFCMPTPSRTKDSTSRSISVTLSVPHSAERYVS